AHMLGADWAWLSRWQGHSPSALPESWDLSTFDALRARWAEVERDQEAFIAGLTDDALRRPLAYRNWAGESCEEPLWQILRHVVNHATYHRGQVVTMLRQLGATAPSTDLIKFYREQAGAGAL